MAYLIILSFITFLLAFAGKLLITYFFIKFFNREKSFLMIFKPILLYELGVFCFFIINPVSLIYLLTSIIPHILLFHVYFLISIIILFLIFKFIMQKFLLLDFKKSLLIFFVVFFIITPLLSFFQVMLEYNISEKLSVFEMWSYLQERERFQQFLSLELKHPSVILFEAVRRLNDIFLGGEFWKGLRNFLITI